MSAAVMGLAALAVLPGGARASLPDGRNYELVSDAGGGANVSAGVPNSAFLVRASLDGRRLLYPNLIPLPGSDDGVLSSYAAQRGDDGWTSTALMPAEPARVVNGEGGPFAIAFSSMLPFTSPDVTKFIINGIGKALVPEWQRPDPGSNDLFFRSLDDPAIVWVTRPLDLNSQPAEQLRLFNANERGSGLHVLFESDEPEDPAYPAVAQGLYEWSDGDAHPTLVGVDENGTPLSGAEPGRPFAPFSYVGSISADGHRVVFQSAGDLYVRVGNGSIHIASGGPKYEGTSNDVTRVYFSLNSAIAGTTAPPQGGLYAYDVPGDGDAAHGHLEFMATMNDSPFAGVVAVAESGRRIYYVDDAGGTPRLYDYSRATRTSTYVATVSTDDNSGQWPLWGSADARTRLGRVSDDGRILIFGSVANGIGTRPYDSAGHKEIFRYDAESGDAPVCMTCRVDGAPASGDAVFSYFGSRSHVRLTHREYLVRALSADGSRAFFTTPDPLVPEDTNNAGDVYEWVDGAPHLISTGKSPADSMLLDASADGDDVFFTTFEGLDPRHSDGTEQIYDARVGASAPVWPQDDPCDGDACQGQTPQTGPTPGPGSAAPGGANATPEDVKPPDAAPRLTVRTLSKKQLGQLRDGKAISLSVGSNGAGGVGAIATARIQGRVRVVAHAKTTTAASSAVKLRLRLSQAARRELRRGHGLHVRLVVTHSAVPRGRSVSFVLRPKSNHDKKGTR